MTTYTIGYTIDGDHIIESDRFDARFDATSRAVQLLNNETDSGSSEFSQVEVIALEDGKMRLQEVVEYDGFGCIIARNPVKGETVGMTIDVLASQR
jgi:hypothetical protein